MRFHRTSFLTLALIALFALVAGSTYANAQNKDSAEISRLLTQAKSHAVQLDSDAAELASYSNSKLSWQSHAHQLEIMRSHVNNLGKLLGEMHSMRSQGSPWQQDAINRVDPLLSQMAHQLTVTIEYGNKYPNRIHMMKYKNYTHACADLASRTANLISDIVAYDKAQSRTQTFEKDLELPTSE